MKRESSLHVNHSSDTSVTSGADERGTERRLLGGAGFQTPRSARLLIVKGGDVLKSFLVVAAAVVTAHLVHAQAPQYVRGDMVRLVAQEIGNPLPDSRVVAVAGDRVRINR